MLQGHSSDEYWRNGYANHWRALGMAWSSVPASHNFWTLQQIISLLGLPCMSLPQRARLFARFTYMRSFETRDPLCHQSLLPILRCSPKNFLALAGEESASLSLFHKLFYIMMTMTLMNGASGDLLDYYHPSGHFLSGMESVPIWLFRYRPLQKSPPLWETPSCNSSLL